MARYILDRKGAKPRAAGMIEPSAAPGHGQVFLPSPAVVTDNRLGSLYWLSGRRLYLSSGVQLLKDAFLDAGVPTPATRPLRWDRNVVGRAGALGAGGNWPWEAPEGASIPRERFVEMLIGLYGLPVVELPTRITLPRIGQVQAWEPSEPTQWIPARPEVEALFSGDFVISGRTPAPRARGSSGSGALWLLVGLGLVASWR